MPLLTQYWRVFWQWRKLEVTRTLTYRNNFFFWSIVSLMWTGFNFFLFNVISTASDGIAGWSPLEMRLLIAVFTIVDTFIWSWFHQNMRNYTNAIFSGEFNGWLLKPIDPQFTAMASVNSFTNVTRLAAGLVVLILTARELQIPLSLGNILGFVCFLTVSLLLIFAWWFMLSTIAFWVEKLDNVNEILPSFRTLWQLPRSVYTGFTATLFTIILPFGLITSLPTEVLLGRSPGTWLVYIALVTGVSWIAARAFFTYSVKKYSGTAQ